MRVFFIIAFNFLLVTFAACSENQGPDNNEKPNPSVSDKNLQNAMQIVDNAISCYFTGSGMSMSRYYNPYTKIRSDEKGSVWMYTASIEAVNAILHGLVAQKENGNTDVYDENFNRYKDLLEKLYDNADYYAGTYELISYTQTKTWTVYGVNRGAAKGTAKVEGIENVYDDQMWLIRELLESYKLTNNAEYLSKAEYLTEYVLDGWDCTFDVYGQERGGIPWGPGYVTKHSCSNGPMISPLVWLHEIYKDKDDDITHRYIDPANKLTRKTVQKKKSEYYLEFAEKVYQFQKKYLLRSDGVYDDMMGGCSPSKPETETVYGVTYRKGGTCRDRVGPAITYNSGTMLSGASDLYRATGKSTYFTDAKNLADASFKYFAKLGETKDGYYTYNISGFRNWFNGVLMRGYMDFYPYYKNVDKYLNSFQMNLDYAFDNFLYENMLPTNLLVGWSYDNSKNRVEGMFTFAFAAEYAVLSRFELEK